MPNPDEMVDPFNFEITLDPDSVARVQKTLAGLRAEIPRVLRLAVNRGVSVVRREMEKLAIEELDIPRAMFRERLWPRRAKKRQQENVVGTVRGGRFGWGVIRLPIAETPHALAVQFTDRIGLYPRGFMAIMPGGHLGAFQRKGQSRLPIEKIKTESITDVLEDLSASPEIREAGAKAVQDKLDKELAQMIEIARKGAP